MHPALTQQMAKTTQLELANLHHHSSFPATQPPRRRLRRLLGHSQVGEAQTK
jgi:hypothetical protein